jgi:PPOX class probable FMN-dependent enzyme
MPDYTSRRLTRVDEVQELAGGDPHRIVPYKLFDHLEPRSQEFIAGSPFLLLATSDREGRLDVSPKGDAAGFVWVEDEHTLWIPDRPGNKLIFGLRNILENPQVGLVFLIPGTQETLRVNGRAELHAAPELLEKLAARGRPAVMGIRVAVEECFFHCAKAFKRSKLWEPATWPERFAISFGALLAPRMGAGADVAREIDAVVDEDYRTGL